MWHIADGACALEIVSIDASRSDVATIPQFVEWSWKVIDTCKIDDDNVKGGIAANLGQWLSYRQRSFGRKVR